MDNNLVDKYLNTLHLKSRDDFDKGCNEKLICKLLNLNSTTSKNILHYLKDKGLIKGKSDNPANIILTYQGIDYVNSYRQNKAFKIIKFSQARYVPPASRMVFGFIYWYDLINENGAVEKKTVSVFASDILSMMWKLPFEQKPEAAEKILLQFAKNLVIEKIEAGDLDTQTEAILMSSSQPRVCPYDPNDLIETKFAEYEVEIINGSKYEIQNRTLPYSNIGIANTMNNNPNAFISYAWESVEIKEWVKKLAIQLRENGIDAKIDQWEITPGDQMSHFMEKSVRENDYVLIICSPKYKIKSENRLGGVGYEGDIMTAEVLQKSNHRKFIPILQSGTNSLSIPSWLAGKYYIDLSNDSHYKQNFEDLITTLFNARENAPKLGNIPNKFQMRSPSSSGLVKNSEEKIRIKGILVDEIAAPSNNGLPGSALYKIPFELNKTPNSEWVNLFINSWNRPPQFTSMHRPGIATVSGNKIMLNGTTIEEVERYHKNTLKLAVEVANKSLDEIQNRKNELEAREQERIANHKKNIDDISKRISFD